MPAKSSSRKHLPDVTSCEILIRPECGEATTMAVAAFLREHAPSIARSVMECIQAGEPVTVKTQGGTYRIKLLGDDEAACHGRFVSPRAPLQSGDWIEAAPQSQAERELEAVG